MHRRARVELGPQPRTIPGARFDHVVFDTAPTGHTLRLLALPAAWTTFLVENRRGASCLGPHTALVTEQDRFAAARTALADGRRTTVVLVARPDEIALREAERTSRELERLGLRAPGALARPVRALLSSMS